MPPPPPLRRRRNCVANGGTGDPSFHCCAKARPRRMLFNSPEFLFLFLPAAVMLHFTLARFGMNAAIAGTILASLAFYAWWNPHFVVLPVASILVNFWLAGRIAAADQPIARLMVIGGI